MQLQSFLIPQADTIEHVVRVIVAVGNGARRDYELVSDIPELNKSSQDNMARQGRYYRHAAELLGLIYNHRNQATLTALGEEFLQNSSIKNPVFIKAVLEIEAVQRLLPFLEKSDSVTKEQIADFFYEIGPQDTDVTTVPRRVSTLLSWLETLNIIRKENGYFHFQSFIIPEVPILNFIDDHQPLLPTPAELTDFQTISERVARAEEAILVYKDLARLDRAIGAHNRLVNLVANRISVAGGIPKSNQLIDLATSIGEDFLFEMKSTNNGNTRSQVRRGISQLNEYRYLQNKKEANLVLVIENELDTSNKWMLDYLESDQGIALIWDGDDLLHASEATRAKLPFLGLVP
ncbi:DUF7226 domain-containing protein [Larkinella terrae]|uniref:DUF7226 domain-containing protein n=1 Tax=Larkinella terrae TaxID=2025311 RepID=A0A7K0ENH9_9BACT|nr:hypothetical protein [Larkinella terrae]MRS63101.1 hypothetical protein [Larkinella terrae]